MGTVDQAAESGGIHFTTVLIIILVIVVVAAIGYLVYRIMRKNRDPRYADKLRRNKEYRDTMNPHKAVLKGAQKEYDARLSARNDAIKAAENEQKKAINAQEKEIKKIEESLNVLVTTFNSVKLYRDHVEYKGKTIRLTPSTKAEIMKADQYLSYQQAQEANARADAQLDNLDVDFTARRSTEVPVSSSVNTALKTTDSKDEPIQANAQVATSYAYLLVSDVASAASKLVVGFEEADEGSATTFVTNLNCAAADVDKLRFQRSQQLDAARNELSRIKADTTKIDAAKEAYRLEAKNRSALDQAQRAYDEAKYEAKKKRDGL